LQEGEIPPVHLKETLQSYNFSALAQCYLWAADFNMKSIIVTKFLKTEQKVTFDIIYICNYLRPSGLYTGLISG